METACGIRLKHGLRNIGLFCLVFCLALLPLYSDEIDEEITFLENLKIELNNLDQTLLNVENLSTQQETKILDLEKSLKISNEQMIQSQEKLNLLENKYQTLNLQLMQESINLESIKKTNVWLSVILGIVSTSILTIGIYNFLN